MAGSVQDFEQRISEIATSDMPRGARRFALQTAARTIRAAAWRGHARGSALAQAERAERLAAETGASEAEVYAEGHVAVSRGYVASRR